MRIGDLEFRDKQGNEINPTKQQMAMVIDKLLKEIYKFEQELAELKEKAIDEINREFVQAVHDWKTLCAEKDKEIERLKQELEETNAGYDFTYEQSTETIKELKQNQTQLAIQELEKVKNFICDYSEITGQAWNHTLRFLNNRIKELKGENYEEKRK